MKYVFELSVKMWKYALWKMRMIICSMEIEDDNMFYRK